MPQSVSVKPWNRKFVASVSYSMVDSIPYQCHSTYFYLHSVYRYIMSEKKDEGKKMKLQTILYSLEL